MSPISDAASPSAVQARPNGLQTTVESLSSLSSRDGATDGRGIQGYGEAATAAGAGTELQTAPADEPEPRWAPTPTVAATSTTSAPASTTTTLVHPNIPEADTSVESPMSKLAIYDRPDPDAEPVASFVAFDKFLFSSASALGDRSMIYLRIGSQFYEATVDFADPLSDVAVIRLSETDVEINLPAFELDVEPVPARTSVYVGYCEADMATAATDAETATAPDSETDRETETETDPATDPEAVCGLSGLKAVGPSRPGGAPQTPPTSSKNKLSGEIYTAESWARSLSDHTLYALIGTQIRQSEEMSGAPLRDRLGHIVGMVAGTAGQYVAAVPIERALNVLQSLLETGTASAAWIGVECERSDNGLAIESIDERSPLADYLQAGDLLTHMNGVPLHDYNHLIHLVREAGVGATIQLSYFSPSGADEVEIVVTASPD